MTCTAFYLRSDRATGCVFPCSAVSLSKHLPWIQHKYFGRWCLEDIRAQALSAEGYRFCFSGQEPWLYWHRYVEEMRLNEEWPWARKQSLQKNKAPGRKCRETKHWRSVRVRRVRGDTVSLQKDDKGNNIDQDFGVFDVQSNLLSFWFLVI